MTAAMVMAMMATAAVRDSSHLIAKEVDLFEFTDVLQRERLVPALGLGLG